ncbi:MAG: OmpP1/FadL family transporter [Candidatus Aminicenantia bacterium]
MVRKNLLVVIIVSLILKNTLWSQGITGQYEDEAPLRTWNIAGVYNARSSGMGETTFAMAEDPSVTLFNPALLSYLNKFSLSINLIFNTAEFFKYSFVNTGGVTYPKNSMAGSYAFDFIGSAIVLRKWTFSLSFSELESYIRPGVDFKYKYQEETYRRITAAFDGKLNNINFSLSRRVGNNFSIGIGINYVFGNIEKNFKDDYYSYQVITADEKKQKFKGYYFNAGISFSLSRKFKLSTFLRTPYIRKSTSEALLRYFSKTTNTEVKIKSNAQDEYKQPLILGLGTYYKLTENLLIASDILFFNWSQYKVEYFDEIRKRDFKNTIKFGMGVEYLYSIKTKWRYKLIIPLRIGYIYDPQPMKNPNSYYNYFTLGNGIHYGKYFSDISLMIGQETGSGNSLHTLKVNLTVGYKL